MTQSLQELEREIEESRARLDLTIDRIQDRLSVSGIVDEFVGSVRMTEFGSVIDRAIAVVRRNPVPVLLVAAGIGWLLHRANQEARAARRPRPARRPMPPAPLEEETVPVLNTGMARVYDPDISPRHPAQDALDTRRDFSARA